jgi:putative transposase
MDGSVRISKKDRKRYLAVVKSDQRVTRAMALLLLEQGITWAVIVSALSTSSSTISRAKAWHDDGGAERVLAERRGQRADYGGCAGKFLQWVIEKCTPEMFGYLRTGWTCDLLSKLMRSMTGVTWSRETMRRWLHRAGLVWRRPRPVVGPSDPQKRRILLRIKRLLKHLPATETAVFQDEVDLNLNPEIGSMWQQKGQQTEIVTPGNNVKRYLSGSLDWRTKRVYSTLGKCRNGEAFIAHLAELNRRLKHFQVVHVICDNAPFHTSKAVRAWLAKQTRIRLVYLPKYSPELNPIERVWWHLRDEITRNHQHPQIAGLIAAALRWLKHRKHQIEGKAYRNLLNA